MRPKVRPKVQRWHFVASERPVAAGLFPFFLLSPTGQSQMVDTERRSWRFKSGSPAGPRTAVVRIPSVMAPLERTTTRTDGGWAPKELWDTWWWWRGRVGGLGGPKHSLMDLLFLFSPSASIWTLWFVTARRCFDVIKWSGAFRLWDSFPKLHCCTLSFERSDQPHLQTSAALTGGCLNAGCPQPVKQNSRVDFSEYLNCNLKKGRERERDARRCRLRWLVGHASGQSGSEMERNLLVVAAWAVLEFDADRSSLRCEKGATTCMKAAEHFQDECQHERGRSAITQL